MIAIVILLLLELRIRMGRELIVLAVDVQSS